MFCGICGAKNPDGAPFCSVCGSSMANTDIPTPQNTPPAYPQTQPAAPSPYAPPPNYPPAAPMPPAAPEKKKSRRALWITLSVLLVLLLAAGAGLLIFMQNSKEDDDSKESSSETSKSEKEDDSSEENENDPAAEEDPEPEEEPEPEEQPEEDLPEEAAFDPEPMVVDFFTARAVADAERLFGLYHPILMETAAEAMGLDSAEEALEYYSEAMIEDLKEQGATPLSFNCGEVEECTASMDSLLSNYYDDFGLTVDQTATVTAEVTEAGSSESYDMQFFFVLIEEEWYMHADTLVVEAPTEPPSEEPASGELNLSQEYLDYFVSYTMDAFFTPDMASFYSVVYPSVLSQLLENEGSSMDELDTFAENANAEIQSVWDLTGASYDDLDYTYEVYVYNDSELETIAERYADYGLTVTNAFEAKVDVTYLGEEAFPCTIAYVEIAGDWWIDPENTRF